jgi:hypothetical protein
MAAGVRPSSAFEVGSKDPEIQELKEQFPKRIGPAPRQ